MGVKGFLISCANRRAISRHAAICSASRRLRLFFHEVLRHLVKRFDQHPDLVIPVVGNAVLQVVARHFRVPFSKA